VLSPSTALRTGLSKHERGKARKQELEGIVPFDSAQDRLRRAQGERYLFRGSLECLPGRLQPVCRVVVADSESSLFEVFKADDGFKNILMRRAVK